jgi:predicted alpha/beta-fold hydrolase
MTLAFPPFQPHPLVRGGHLQTIIGNSLPSRLPARSILHEVPLADGDAIAVHEDEPVAGQAESEVPADSIASIAVLVHGLGGCHQSGYIARCSAKLRARGVRVFRMDLRGCGAGMMLARLPLHAGRSEDAAGVVDFLSQRWQKAAIHVVGFSMGANIALKLAGEWADQPPPSVASVMGVSPPLDLAACAENIQKGLNRIYDLRFVRSMFRHVRQREALVPQYVTRELVPRPRRLIDFDTVFTAPLSGFADVNDYYARASCGPLLSRITVPSLIIHAASDPIVPTRPFEVATYSATTELLITSCGGHLGFIGAHGSDADCRWLDWRVVDWVTARAVRQNVQWRAEPVPAPLQLAPIMRGS